MGQKPDTKTAIFYTSLCGAIAMLALLVASFPHLAIAALDKDKTATLEARPEILAALSGFEPDADVTYQIIETGGKVFTGKAKVTPGGLVNLPMLAEVSPKTAVVAYRFIIEEREKTLNFKLLHDSTTGLVTLDGSGADEFSDIELDLGDHAVKTKSDWAGLFAESDLALPLSEKSKSDNSYKLAFFSANASDASGAIQNPAKIEVFYQAIGGGGPTSELVNDFEATYCGSGPQISYCDTDRITAQNENIVTNLVEPLLMMAEEIVHSMMGNAGQIGRYFDSKEQLEAQRDMQALKAQAVKDYHPSDLMCRFGTFSRSLAKSEQKSISDKIALNKALSDSSHNKEGGETMGGPVTSTKTRLKQYREVYCDPHDHNAQLFLLCEHDQDKNFGNSTPGNAPPEGLGAQFNLRVNKDIDIARTLEYPLTLNIAFDDGEFTPDEEDVVALGRNLYWSNAVTDLEQAKFRTNAFNFQEVRRLIALNNVAHHSYANIVALKAESPQPAEGAMPGWAYMKTMLRELGMTDQDIEYMVGENPSYYAQMDILTKKIYQNPDFYTNLYDKPTNIDRIMATLDAISLMQQRDHYNASLRREMVSSAMITEALQVHIQSINGTIEDMQ